MIVLPSFSGPDRAVRDLSIAGDELFNGRDEICNNGK